MPSARSLHWAVCLQMKCNHTKHKRQSGERWRAGDRHAIIVHMKFHTHTMNFRLLYGTWILCVSQMPFVFLSAFSYNDYHKICIPRSYALKCSLSIYAVVVWAGIVAMTHATFVHLIVHHINEWKRNEYDIKLCRDQIEWKNAANKL